MEDGSATVGALVLHFLAAHVSANDAANGGTPSVLLLFAALALVLGIVAA